MKVTSYVVFEKEVEVEVDIEQIVAAICEDPNSKAPVLRGLNNMATFFKGTPDSLIRQFTELQRKTIAEFLHEQADRFSVRADK